MNKENNEDQPRNIQTRITNSPRMREDYNTQVSGEGEGPVKNKLSQEFNRTESRISGASSRLDEFLQNPQF